MTFEKLAKLVADDFKATMLEEGFKTFKEMQRCYDWDAQDIKDEVSSIINELSAKYWEEEQDYFFIADDCSFVQIGVCDEMSWGQFKKAIFEHVK